MGDWTKRFERLEAEVKRLTDQVTRQYLEDEVHRLDEKVEFLENLLADRPQTGALPSADREDSARKQSSHGEPPAQSSR